MKCILLVLAALLISANVSAKPLAFATQGKVTVTLTDEPCKLSQVTNLPYRAYWKEGNKAYEGCFSIFGPAVGLFFDDGSVAIAPLMDFQTLTGA